MDSTPEGRENGKMRIMAMTPVLKLSQTQMDLMAKVRAAGGRIEYRKGGFWTAPGVPEVRPGVPAWYFGWETIAALRDRGVLVLTRRSDRQLPAEFQLASEHAL